ncbi:conjugal transfer mating-pair stabilization protein TraG [Photobacterium leiognathi]|uniref:conjugal transfer mating-pair stabilization protein TraG n=1 Tax=Photobacterium leiognathi TaxID=553611 RepID=UPI002738705A|nr:conjugal transfer mating-pair stabilization protein TraG [Photobacterium leiognathi]
MLTIYVFSGGYTAERVFNALATFFRGESWASLIIIIGIIALFMTAVRFLMTRDHTHILSYLATNLVVTSLLLTPTTSVRIDDASHPGRVYIVDHVPIGLAAPVHYATTLMHGLSQAIDFIFVTPTDESYAKSGMLFGSRLVRLTHSIGIQDGELKQLWSQYTQNCIRKDITINKKYTWNEFATSNDIFTFLNNHRPSPLRRIAMNGDFITCKEALPQLEQRFITEARNGIGLLGTQSLLNARNAALLENAVSNSYRSFYNISKSATDILKQNIAINGIKSALYDGAASMNATAAAFNYAQAQNNAQTQSTMTSIGLSAQEWLPIVHSVLILLLACSAIPVLLAAFMPGLTLKVIQGYIGGFFYLAIWPLFFTFINMIMTYSLQAAGARSTTLLHGMSLSGADPMMAMHMKYAAIAGWLMMMVPFIARYAFLGGSAMVSGLAQQMINVANGNAAKTASAAASGDLSYGVVQTNVWQNNSASGNKFDMGYSNHSYAASLQRADGTHATYMPTGGAIYSSRGAISTPAFDLTSSEVQSRTLRNSIAETERATAQARTSYNNSVGNVSDQLLSLTQTASQNHSYGSGTQSGQTANLQDTLTKMDSLIADYARSHNVSKSQASKEMSDLYFGFGGNIGGSIGVGRDVGVGEGKASVGGSGNIGYKKTYSDIETSDTRQDRSNRTATTKQNQFNDLMGQLQQYTTGENTNEVTGFNQQAISHFNDSVRKTKDFARAYDASYAREQSYSQVLDDLQSGSLNINHNLIPEFQAFVAKYSDNVEAVMNGNTPAINEEREAYFESFMERKFAHYNPEMKEALNNSEIRQPVIALQGGNLRDHYQRNSAVIEEEYSRHATSSQTLENQAQQAQDALYQASRYEEDKNHHAEQREAIENEVSTIKKHR